MKKLLCLCLAFGFLCSATACSSMLGATPFENVDSSAFEETQLAAE